MDYSPSQFIPVRPPLPESASCLGCGYALRGLPEARCPECGRRFNPIAPSTMKPPPPPLPPEWRAALERSELTVSRPTPPVDAARTLFTVATVVCVIGSPWVFGGERVGHDLGYGVALWLAGGLCLLRARRRRQHVGARTAAYFTLLGVVSLLASCYHVRCPHEHTLYFGPLRIALWEHPLGPCGNYPKEPRPLWDW
jgi:hypothetical protein